MKDFSVTYRGKDGKQDVIQIAAEDRQGVFDELAKRGISAVRIEETTGKTKSHKTIATRKSGMSHSIGRGLIAGVLVVAAAVGAWYFLTRGTGNGERRTENVPKKTAKIAEVKPEQKKPTTSNKPATNAAPSKTAKPVLPILGKTPTGEEYVAMTAKTNEDGVVTERYQLPDGSWKRVVQLQRKETMVFDNDFDLALSLIATTPMDQELPPMPEMGEDLEAVFKKAIESPIIIKETDSDRVKEMKRGAQQIRLEIADLLAEGYSIKQILNEHNGLRQQNIEIRREFQTELNNIYRSGDIEGAQKYLETMNKALDEKGILPLVMPGSTESAKRRSRK